MIPIPRRNNRLTGVFALAAAMLSWAMMVEATGGRLEARAGQDAPPPAPVPALEGPAPVDMPEGVEVLTRGPVHEAFAEPVVFNPEAGLIVEKEAPPAVEELPPAQKPEGDDVVWIPGYWAWDDTRDDYLWVSGIWRKLPPGRQWVPGYWARVDQGFQWVSGYWAPLEQEEIEYLPTPPETLEVGPNVPAPGEEYVWNPGYWSWHEQRYAWSPGSWIAAQPNWIWVPPSYRYTPAGCIFVPGFWDYIIADRGMLFAPAYFGPAFFAQPVMVYQPAIVINIALLTDNFFCRPSYGHYFFGDYYGFSGVGQPYMPWFAFHQSRRGFDPIYAWSAARQERGWATVVRERYHERVIQTDFRPPHTYRQYRQWALDRRGTGHEAPALARTLAQVQTAREIQNVRLERVDANRQAELARRTEMLDHFRAQRIERENVPRERMAQALANRSQAQAVAEARRVQMPRSPLAAARLASGERFGSVQEAAAEAVRRRQESLGQLNQRRQEAAAEARATQARTAEANRARGDGLRSNLAEAIQQRQELQRAGQAEALQRRRQLQSSQADAIRQRLEQRATLDQNAQRTANDRRQAAEAALQGRNPQQPGTAWQGAERERRQEQVRQLQERRQQLQQGQAGPRMIVPGAGSQPNANPVDPNRTFPGQIIERRQQALQQQAQQAQAARDAAQQQAALRQQQQATQQQLDALRQRQQQLDALRQRQQGNAQQQPFPNLRSPQGQADALYQQRMDSLRRQQLDAGRRQQQFNPQRSFQPGGGQRMQMQPEAPRRQFQQPPQRPAMGGGGAQVERRRQAVEELQRRREQLRGPRP